MEQRLDARFIKPRTRNRRDNADGLSRGADERTPLHRSLPLPAHDPQVDAVRQGTLNVSRQPSGSTGDVGQGVREPVTEAALVTLWARLDGPT